MRIADEVFPGRDARSKRDGETFRDRRAWQIAERRKNFREPQKGRLESAPSETRLVPSWRALETRSERYREDSRLLAGRVARRLSKIRPNVKQGKRKGEGKRRSCAAVSLRKLSYG